MNYEQWLPVTEQQLVFIFQENETWLTFHGYSKGDFEANWSCSSAGHWPRCAPLYSRGPLTESFELLVEKLLNFISWTIA